MPPQVKIRLAVVDDHKLFIEGIVGLLKSYDELTVNFTAGNGIEFFEELLKRKRPIDIVLLDMQMPGMDGLAVLRRLKVTNPEIKPLVLTMHNEDELIYEMVELGALGLLPKTADIEEVVNAIFSVYNNELYFNDEVSQRVIKKLVKKEKIKRINVNEGLSYREKEIIKLICNEYTAREIAEKLFISERTIDAHKTSIFEKTKTKNTAGLVMYAFRTGIVE
jgi:DNA-binding NarL/FixJ family response regulator